MNSVLNMLIAQLNSAVVVLILMLVIFVIGVYKFGGFVSRWQDRDSDLKDLKDKLYDNYSYLKVRVDLIFQQIYPNTAVKSGSPIQLTTIGKKISEAINAREIMKDQQAELEKLVNDASPDNAYDLQQACFSVVEQNLPNMLDGEQLDAAKQQSVEYGIPLDNALSVVAILLRDQMIKDKGWSISDVDELQANK